MNRYKGVQPTVVSECERGRDGDKQVILHLETKIRDTMVGFHDATRFATPHNYLILSYLLGARMRIFVAGEVRDG